MLLGAMPCRLSKSTMKLKNAEELNDAIGFLLTTLDLNGVREVQPVLVEHGVIVKCGEHGPRCHVAGVQNISSKGNFFKIKRRYETGSRYTHLESKLLYVLPVSA